jgi:hypothetical protein
MNLKQNVPQPFGQLVFLCMLLSLYFQAFAWLPKEAVESILKEFELLEKVRQTYRFKGSGVCNLTSKL